MTSNGDGARRLRVGSPVELAFCCSPSLQVNPPERKPRACDFRIRSVSVSAGVRPGVGRPIIRAIVAVEASANEATPSRAQVLVADMRHARAKATDMASIKTSNATAAKATHVAATEPTTHVTAAEAATHMAAAEAAATATVSTATAAATAARLCTGSKKAAGQHRACQNHHHSSSHDILL